MACERGIQGAAGGVFSIGGPVGVIADAVGSPSEIGDGDSSATVSGAVMKPKADGLLFFPSPMMVPAGLPAAKTRLPLFRFLFL